MILSDNITLNDFSHEKNYDTIEIESQHSYLSLLNKSRLLWLYERIFSLNLILFIITAFIISTLHILQSLEILSIELCYKDEIFCF